jgi:hypothetical protein
MRMGTVRKYSDIEQKVIDAGSAMAAPVDFGAYGKWATGLGIAGGLAGLYVGALVPDYLQITSAVPEYLHQVIDVSSAAVGAATGLIAGSAIPFAVKIYRESRS